MSTDTRSIVREELEREQNKRAFWAGVTARCPRARGHRELVEGMMADPDKIAHLATLSVEAGLDAFADMVDREIARRERRDAHNKEAEAYGPGPMGTAGHGIDARTGETVTLSDDGFEDTPRSLGDNIRARRAARREASRKWLTDAGAGDESVQRRRGNYAQ